MVKILMLIILWTALRSWVWIDYLSSFIQFDFGSFINSSMHHFLSTHGFLKLHFAFQVLLCSFVHFSTTSIFSVFKCNRRVWVQSSSTWHLSHLHFFSDFINIWSNIIFHTDGSLFLFDRKVLRYFRKDGHKWRKKKDGKTVKEAHERLKVKLNGPSFSDCQESLMMETSYLWNSVFPSNYFDL